MTKAKMNMDLFNKLTQRYKQKNNGNNNNKDFPDQGFDFAALKGTGRYIIRLMPYEPDAVSMDGTIMPFYVQNKHYNLGVDKKEKVTCISSFKEGAVCPICSALEELSELGFEREQLKPYEISTKVVVKCLILQTPEKMRDELPMNRMSMFYVSPSVASKIMEKYMDPTTPDLFNPDKSCAIAIERDKPRDKWNISIMDSSCEECGILGFTEENKNKLLSISQEIQFSKIYKIPSDEKIMHYKELAREMKKRIINAKSAVESATDEFKTEIEASSASVPEKIDIPLPTTAAVQKQPEIVATPTVPVTAEVQEVESVLAGAEPKTDAEELGPDPNWTPDQKKIIDSYRGMCDKPCFGNIKAYNPKCARCLADNFSAQCNAAINLAYGVNVPLF